MKVPPIVFILGQQPAPEDQDKYNAFGILKDFGKAYAAYYAARDEEEKLAARKQAG